jgi:molybdopterin-dependent oxidoreductase-like protein protein
MAVVLAGFAVVVGLLAARSLALGLAGVTAFGAVGVAAALSRPAGPVDALPSFVGGLAGAGALVVLVRQLRPAPLTASHQEHPTGAGVDRRRFLLTGALVAGGAALAGTGGRVLARRFDISASLAAVSIPTPASTAAPLAEAAALETPGLSAFYTPNRDFYRVDTALVVPRVAAEDWRLRVHGMVGRELELDFKQLLSRALIERDITLSCVSNQVGGPYVGTARWVGVPLRDLLEEAGVKQGAE